MLLHDNEVLLLHHTKTKSWTDVGGKVEARDDGDPRATLAREMAEEIFGNDVGMAEALLNGHADARIWIEACKSYLYVLELDERPDVDLSYEKNTHGKCEWVPLARIGKSKRKLDFRLQRALKHLPRPGVTATARPTPAAMAPGAFKVLPEEEECIIILTEKFDRTRLEILIALNMCDPEIQVELKEYLKTAKDGRKIDVRYTHKGAGVGRFRICQLAKAEAKDADAEASGGYTQSRMKNLAKGCLLSEVYHDVDFKNCHPEILLQLLIHHELPSDGMRRFNTERDSVLHELMASMDVDRDAAKVLVFRILYGGSVTRWCRDNDVDRTLLPILPRACYP